MSATELQALLRFLSQDAKLPLATAMSKVKELQSADLNSTEKLATAKLENVQKIFTDEKISKQIISAAKRVTKKRAAGGDAAPSPKKKRKESLFSDEPVSGAELETSLALPECTLYNDELADTVLFTNRAPLVLAFVVTLLKYTLPQQPLSSRLSLAQAYVSITSRSRAVNLGIESGKSAEEEGFGEGQPVVTIMGKEIRVLRRWDQESNVDTGDNDATAASIATAASTENTGDKGKRESLKVENDDAMKDHEIYEEESPALWAIDLEALKKSNNNEPLASAQVANYSNIPIYTPQSARAYLLKSFDSASGGDGTATKKSTAAARVAVKEQNLGKLLHALDIVYESWSKVIGPDDLDKRTWSWYVKVRPAVENGVAGWGGKNQVKLADILALRRET